MRKCQSCGREVPDGIKFCIECGAPIPQVGEQHTCVLAHSWFGFECGEHEVSAKGFSDRDAAVQSLRKTITEENYLNEGESVDEAVARALDKGYCFNDGESSWIWRIVCV